MYALMEQQQVGVARDSQLLLQIVLFRELLTAGKDN